MRLVILLCSLVIIQTSFASWSGFKSNKKSEYRLSVDNLLFKDFSSQENGTDISFSLANEVDRLYNAHPGVITFLLAWYADATIALWNHEIVGHGARAKDVGTEVIEFGYIEGMFGLGAYTMYMPPQYLQQDTVILTGGVEAAYLLSQRLTKQMIQNNSTITPSTGMSYIMGSTQQFEYIMQKGKPGSVGHDMLLYADTIQSMYGRNSITIEKMKSIGWIDLLDPMLFGSMYAIIKHEPVEPPMLDVGSFKFMPALKLVLTPYGVLEKRLVTYVKTPERIMKISLGFGQEQKTTILPDESSHYPDALPTTGVLANPNNNHTYFAEVFVDKILSINQFDIGVTAALWYQPKLFTTNPYNSPMKLGGMFLANATYRYKEDFDIFMDLGYKQHGYVLGQPTKDTPIVRIGLDWRI